MAPKRGQIIDYEVQDADGNVTETLPMLVVGVNEERSAGRDARGNDVPNESFGTVLGVVFNHDGTTRPVTIAGNGQDAGGDGVPSFKSKADAIDYANAHDLDVDQSLGADEYKKAVTAAATERNSTQ